MAMAMGYSAEVLGLRIVSRVNVWSFPRSRFVQYGPEDEAWARPLGFGREASGQRVLEVPQAFIKSCAFDAEDCTMHLDVSCDAFALQVIAEAYRR